MQINEIHKALKYLITGGGILKIISLGTLYFIVKSLGVYGYGEYTITIAAISLFTVTYKLVSGQLYQIELARIIGEQKYHYAKIIQNQAFLIITIITFFFAAITFGLFIIFSDSHIYLNHISKYSSHILIGILYLFTYGYKSVMVTTNRSFGYFREQTCWDVVEAVWRFFVIFLIFFLLSKSLSVVQILFIDWVALLLGWLTYRIFFYKEYNFNDFSKKDKEISLFNVIKNNGVWFFFRLLILDLNTNVRLWIITLFLSVEAVGIFGVSKKILQSTKFLLPFGVILNSFLPQNAKNENILRKTYIQGLSVSIVLSMLVIILIFLITFMIVPYIFPEMGNTLQILILISSGMFFVKAWGYSINSMLGLDRKYKNLFLIGSLSIISTLTVLPLLINIIGIYGIAFEMLFNSTIAFFISYYFLLKQRPHFWLKLDDFKKILSLKNLNQLKLILRG